MKKILFLVSILIPSIVFAGPHVRNESQSTLYSAEGDTQPTSAVDRYGNQMCSLNSGTAAATNPVKLEDTVSASGDAGIPMFGIRNEAAATFADKNGDYSPIATNRDGAIYIAYNVDVAGDADGTSQPVKREDSAPANTDAGMVSLVRGIGTGSLAPSAGTSGDYEWQNNDSDGRLFVNPWGANPGQWFQTCGTATATTADVAIKTAAGASVRNYVLTITCSNSSATTATNLNFKDGSTVIAVGGVNQMATTSSGAFTATFNPPLRSTGNTAINFNTAVSVSSVICCATGFTSANS